MTQSKQAVSPLRQRMIDDMRLRKLEPKTRTAYLRAVQKLAVFLKHPPDTATVEEQCPIAKRGDDARVVADDEHRAAGRPQLPVALLAPGFEAGVADRENLVQHEHVPNGLERDRVSQP